MTTPGTTPLHELTVSEIAESVAAGRLRPIDLVEALLSRIAALDDRVHAWSYLDADAVRAEAQALTDEAARGKLRGPLHGVPVGVKDEFHVQGMPTEMRGRVKPVPEPEDAFSVARLR